MEWHSTMGALARDMICGTTGALALMAALACGGGTSPSGSSAPGAVPETPETAAAGTALVPIAEVNGVVIPRLLYTQTLNYLRARIPQGQVERYLNAKFDAMESIVNDELLYQEAARRGFTVSDAAVEASLKEAAGPGGEQAFLQSMASQGFTDDLVRQTIRKRTTIDRFVEEVLIKDIEASEEETLEYYNGNLERFTPEKWVHVQRILIRIPPNADAADTATARQRAESILSLLRRGEKFEDMAHEYSEDQVAAIGGDLGFIKRGVASPAFDAVAFNLRPGEISDVVGDDSGFHIIRLLETRGGAPLAYEEVKEKCRERVLAQKKDLMIRAMTNRLRDTASIQSFEE